MTGTRGPAAALLATTAGCGQSYDDIVKECRKILVERPAGETGKPDACSDVKEDDYKLISVSAAMDKLKWTDENGRFSEEKMLEDLNRR
ncbi:hypothetical protein [Streptomyces sp. NPDC023588]|uniref:hypothetical protein n=1 Tax=Streptomyces sp. NPDC023588 TaxID=3154907 RepID=UPI003411D0C7